MNTDSIWFAETPQAVREQKVDKGLALLDEKYGPDKVNAIDLEILDIGSQCCCAIAQVANKHYRMAIEEVGLSYKRGAALHPSNYGLACSHWDTAESNIDDRERLTAVFRQRINARRAAAEQQKLAA